MAFTLAFSIISFPPGILWPRNSTSCWANEHFFNLRKSSLSQSTWRTYRKCWACFSSVVLYTTMSFKYTTTKRSRNGWSALCHEHAKCGGCITEAKRHDKEFERPAPCCARCLRFVSLGDAHLIVPGAQVEFGEVPRLTKLVEQVCNQGNQILVIDGDLVERSIIDAYS